MSTINYNEANRHLMAVAVLVSPTGKEQEAFGRMCNLMYGDGLVEKEIFLGLLGAIQDGVKNGNWPTNN